MYLTIYFSRSFVYYIIIIVVVVLVRSRFVRFTVTRSSRFYFIRYYYYYYYHLLWFCHSHCYTCPGSFVLVHALIQGVFGEIMERCVSLANGFWWMMTAAVSEPSRADALFGACILLFGLLARLVEYYGGKKKYDPEKMLCRMILHGRNLRVQRTKTHRLNEYVCVDVYGRDGYERKQPIIRSV